MFANRRLWLGIAVTGGFLLLLLLRVDFSEMGSAFLNANYAYLLPGIAVYFVALYIRAIRWRYVLRPFARTRANRLFPVVLIGYMANNLLPVRMGELARSYYLSTREPVRGSTALATIIVERVFDGLVMLLLLVVAAFFLPVLGLAERVGSATGLPEWALGTLVVLPFVSVLGMMIVIAVYPAVFRQFALNLSQRLPDSVGLRAYGLVERFIAGFTGLQKPSRLAAVFALSLPIWLVEGLMYYIIAVGFGLHDQVGGFAELGIVMIAFTAVANLATSIPSSQGSIGPFEFFSAMALTFLGVTSGVASAYVIVLHAALLLPVIGIGMVYLATQSLSLGQLTRIPRHQETVGPEASPASSRGTQQKESP
ncbi:MAG: lysylphosphatidylglycerol synthase transmembrane domain-containing protein [Dehalococcoidia bacterium]